MSEPDSSTPPSYSSDRLRPVVIEDTRKFNVLHRHPQGRPAISDQQLSEIKEWADEIRGQKCSWAPLVMMFSDLVAWSFCFLLATVIRKILGAQFEFSQYSLALLSLLPSVIIIFSWIGLYRSPPSPAADELRGIFRACSILLLAFIAGTFLIKESEHWSRAIILMTWSFAILFVPLARWFTRSMAAQSSYWGKPVLIVGGGETAELLIEKLRRERRLCLRPVAVIGDEEGRSIFCGLPCFGPRLIAGRLATLANIDSVIVAQPSLQHVDQLHLVESLVDEVPNITYIPPLFGIASSWATVQDLGGTLGLNIANELLIPSRRLLKRGLDLIITLTLFIIFSPLFVLLVCLVRCSSAGPVFYGQRRIGQYGKVFNVWKFRSMVINADKILLEYLEENSEAKSEWDRNHKLMNDPRITWIGRFLRVNSLDELPQLWNVLIGQMSLVGPRPIVEAEISKYGNYYHYYRQVPPGMTGLWQVSGRNLTTYDERIALDSYYSRNWSVWLDFVILARTIKTVLLREGAV